MDGNIYVIGGWNKALLKTVEMYDPRLDRWEPKASLSQGNLGVAAATVNSKIYAMGWGVADNGVRPRSDVYEYDPTLDKWTKKADMPTTRYAISATAVNWKIYAVGGASSFNPYRIVPTVEIYDPNTDMWEKGINLPNARAYHVSAIVDGRIYIIGGADAWPNPNSATDSVLSTVEVFDTGLSVSPQESL